MTKPKEDRPTPAGHKRGRPFENGESRKPRPPAITVPLTDVERTKLEWLRDKRGDRATLVSTIRELIMEASR